MDILIILPKEIEKKDIFLKNRNIIFNKIKNIIYLTYSDSINFINNNKNKTIIFYGEYFEYHYNLAIYLNKNGNNGNKIVFFPIDFWYFGWIKNPKLKHLQNIFKAKNYKVFCFCYNLEQLNKYHDFNYNEYKNNIIFENLWCCYKGSFIKYNENPIEKLLICGRISNVCYPERYILSQLKKKNHKIEIYEYNNNDYKNYNFSKKLNNYLCCFSSSIYVQTRKNKKYINTNIILQKTFEILGSGSLLVCPKKEELYLKNIGLIHNKNCYLIDFTNNITQQIEYIFKNKEKYNKIRKEGQIFAKENFNQDIKFKNIINKFNL